MKTKKCRSCKAEIPADASKCSHCSASQHGWFRRHPILTVLLVLFVLGMIGAASGGNGKTGSTATEATQKAEEAKNEAPMQISAQELADEFDSNQVAAESKWKGKLVEFSAEITNITDSGLSFSKVASKEFSMAQISCRVNDTKQLLSLKNGQTVTVQGTVDSQTLGVIGVSNCEVVK